MSTIWLVYVSLDLKSSSSMGVLEVSSPCSTMWDSASGIVAVDVLLEVMMLWVMIAFLVFSFFVIVSMMCRLVWCGTKVVSLFGWMFVWWYVLSVIGVICDVV